MERDMISNKELKKYNKKNSHSYTFSMFPTFELLQNKVQYVEMVLLHTNVSKENRKKVYDICEKNNIDITINDHIIERIRDKDNCLLIGVFRKYSCELVHNRNHVVLVNPSDSGNMGTIIRTCVGFGIHDLAVIEPAVDIFSPKVVRATMGALFHINFQSFSSFEEYYKKYGNERKIYPFMLKGAVALDEIYPENVPFSLVFGNEATGLDDGWLDVGKSILIPHSKEIDSLNLSLAVGIGLYEFTKKVKSPDKKYQCRHNSCG